MHTDTMVLFTSIGMTIVIAIIVISIIAGVGITVYFKKKISQQHQIESKRK